MLTELRLSNFRVFDDEVTIRFRPITVLIGKNNAGKSSVIKFLSMLRQSIGTRDDLFLYPRSEHTNLGSRFFDLKNTRSRKRGLKFHLSMPGAESPVDVVGLYLKQKDIDPHVYKPQYQVFSNVLYHRQGTFRGVRWGIALFADNKKILTRQVAITENSKFLDFVSEPQEQSVAADSTDRVVQHCAELIGHKVNSTDHIAPVKINTQRTIDVGENVPVNYVGPDGEYALHHLYKLWKQRNEFDGQREKYKFVLEHLQKILNIKAIDFLGRGDLVQCKAVNAKTGARTNIANFGFGVSQCLPILVQGAIMHPRTTLMVEQPEAQVHPTAQLDLGSYIARLWKERQVGSIVETHSNNLLLRLRRLIAEGDGYLKPGDVSIAFFDLDEGKAVVKNLDIDQDGLVEDGLPMEFFGADIREGLKLSAAKYKGPDNEDE